MAIQRTLGGAHQSQMPCLNLPRAGRAKLIQDLPMVDDLRFQTAIRHRRPTDNVRQICRELPAEELRLPIVHRFAVVSLRIVLKSTELRVDNLIYNLIATLVHLCCFCLFVAANVNCPIPGSIRICLVAERKGWHHGPKILGCLVSWTPLPR